MLIEDAPGPRRATFHVNAASRITQQEIDAVDLSRRDVHPRLIVNWARLAWFAWFGAVMLLVGMMIGGTIVAVATEAVSSSKIGACATEDSDGCYWDADTMGNGAGHDSVVLP